MSKKDYELIARALRASRVTIGDVNSETGSRKAIFNNGIDNAAARLADALGAENAKFDRARFLAACGVAA